LCLVEVKPAPSIVATLFISEPEPSRFALPAQLAVKRVLHQYRQVLQSLVPPAPAFAKPVVAGAQFQDHLRVLMHNLQNMPEAVAVYLAGIQRLRAFEQHFELLMGFIQMLRLFRNRVFQNDTANAARPTYG
jgi:hypothetical protein